MFPQEGEKEPRVRFKGFCGEWTSQFASEVFSPIKNNSLSRADLSASGEVMNIHYGDILIKFNECIYEYGNKVKSLFYLVINHLVDSLAVSYLITIFALR